MWWCGYTLCLSETSVAVVLDCCLFPLLHSRAIGNAAAAHRRTLAPRPPAGRRTTAHSPQSTRGTERGVPAKIGNPVLCRIARRIEHGRLGGGTEPVHSQPVLPLKGLMTGPTPASRKFTRGGRHRARYSVYEESHSPRSCSLHELHLSRLSGAVASVTCFA